MTGSPRHAGRPGHDALTVAQLVNRDATSTRPEAESAVLPAATPPGSPHPSDWRQWRRTAARPTRRQLMIAAAVVAAVTRPAPSRSSTEPAASPVPRISLTTSHAQMGQTYLATAAGFLPGEQVLFSWTGPTSGAMGMFPADSAGNAAVPGPILEKDPPGSYRIIATGLRSGRGDSAPLQVLPPP